MRALVVTPGKPGSARLEDVPEPAAEQGALLVQTLAVGVCGTDREILAGEYGSAPPGEAYLVLGHESLGRVLEAPAGSGLSAGDLVVGIVRRPDPVPCPNCAVGEWDMCRNGRYTERCIKERDGYCSERFSIDPAYVIAVHPSLGDLGVLVEPTSVLAKAWEHIEHIGSRATWVPKTVLVTGAGPIGLLAALLGVQRGLEIHVLDRETDGPKPELVRSLGATYHMQTLQETGLLPDVVVECTGADELVFDVMEHTAPDGIVCLTGVSSAGRTVHVDPGALNRTMVLENDVVFGSVNANRRHWEAAAEALAKADRGWLESLVTRRVSLDDWSGALDRRPGDVKTVIDFSL